MSEQIKSVSVPSVPSPHMESAAALLGISVEELRARLIPPPESKPRRMSREEAEGYLGISSPFLWRLTATGRIPAIRIGRRVLYDSTDLDAFLASCKRRKRSKAKSIEGR